MRFGVEPKKAKTQTKMATTRKPVINATYCLYRSKKLIKRLFEEIMDTTQIIIEFVKRVQSKIELSRKGQHNPRRKHKGELTKFSMNYKPI